jgi:DNA-binding response OmpR family regulator
MKILLVEDHEDTLMLMARLLQRLNYSVTTASTIAAARAAAKRDSYDMLISDLALPDGTGADLMREMCERKSIKGIALTGYGDNEMMNMVNGSGFSAHLTKPIDFGKLQKLIQDIADAPNDCRETMKATAE